MGSTSGLSPDEELVRLLHTSGSEVTGKRKMRRRAFGESPIIALVKSGVKEVKGLPNPQR
jgi:hypothetical protein